MGLLKRLTTGMAKREDEGEPAQVVAEPTRTVETVEPVAVQRAPQPSAHGHAQAHGTARTGATDPYGRQVANARSAQDDELEIPAFLRRSAG